MTAIAYAPRKIWLLGLGFFSISITWALYNAYVPLYLEHFIKNVGLIGFMMTIDNYFAMFLQPWIGRKSDRTRTKFGKRMPFLLIGMPLAAVFGALIPWHNGIVTLILFMVLMNLSMSLYRSPTVALMPDLTPPGKRTQANGIINFMGGVGSILAFAGGAYLNDWHTSLPFLTSSVLTLLCLTVLFFVIREPHAASFVLERKAEALPGDYRKEWNKPTLFLLGAIFFWFFSYQGVEALFTLYGTNRLGMTDSAAAFSLAFFSLSFVIAAIPSGMLGNRFGKKKIILLGIIGLIVVFSLVSLIESVLLLRIMLLIGGVFWACININSYPFIVQLGEESSIGTRTGIYYIASSIAAISSPPLMGVIIDWMGYAMLFYIAAAGMVIALLFLLGVRDQGKSLPVQPPVTM
ncbi:MFS transporter [Paenibacillus agaridevorans]|jgi:maltose/moltooligosaccharide transporter|uniref:MFS transporter n=1 Tax=Paenibacillus agaridevorans TaxID=171404 RepID=A0A2R5EYK3_9BACL|nr:MFS transporter [Paenibacillus agaridevorans]GBG11796.1 MFS transporter [Paenibacillus agaridevorans]